MEIANPEEYVWNISLDGSQVKSIFNHMDPRLKRTY